MVVDVGGALVVGGRLVSAVHPDVSVGRQELEVLVVAVARQPELLGDGIERGVGASAGACVGAEVGVDRLGLRGQALVAHGHLRDDAVAVGFDARDEQQVSGHGAHLPRQGHAGQFACEDFVWVLIWGCP